MHIIAISPNRWYGQWMNRQHLMWALKDLAPVLYVQEPEGWQYGLGCRDERFLRPDQERVGPGLTVLRMPKCLCRRGREGAWNRATCALKGRIAREALRRDEGPVVLYIWHPQFWGYADALRPDLTVYHMYDLVSEYHEPKHKETTLRRWFERACREADVVITGTAQQAAAVPGRDDVEILSNGVPWDWYAPDNRGPEPDDLACIARPRIGYVGTVSNKVDLGWLARISDRADWQIVLVGPDRTRGDDREKFCRLRVRPNVHYLGEKPADRVPAYIQGLDVGLMGYRRNLHCETSSPLKLYEYCAAGLPIVSSRLPSLIADPQLGRFLDLCDTAEEAASRIDDLLHRAPSMTERVARLAFAQDNSWDQRARRIGAILRDRQVQRRGVARNAPQSGSWV